jgi:hypothetical protein
MSYTKDYSGQAEWMARVDALKDTQDYLGKTVFRRVVKLLKNDYTSTKRALYIGLAICGVEGYPAYVMIDTYAPKQLKLF